MSFIDDLKSYLSDNFDAVFDHEKIQDPIQKLRAFVNDIPQEVEPLGEPVEKPESSPSVEELSDEFSDAREEDGSVIEA